MLTHVQILLVFELADVQRVLEQRMQVATIERPPTFGTTRLGLPRLGQPVPYLAATYDERMFEELYRRAQLFEVTLGGDMRVEGRIELEHVKGEKRKREKAGIGTEDEDLGQESDDTGAVDLPKDMVERLRVDLSVWKPRPGNANGKH